MTALRDRLIFALDVATAADARAWVDRLGDSVTFYKLGMELLTSGDYFRVLEDLAGRGKRVFVDLKFHDVPATVAATIRGLRRYPVDFCTLHAQHGAMMRAAAQEKGGIRLLGVTVLTSMDRADLRDLRIDAEPADIVVERALHAQDAGLDGVIASGREAAALRAATGPGFLLTTRSEPSTCRARSPPAPTTSSWAGRSARPRTPWRPPRPSTPRSPRPWPTGRERQIC